MNKTENKKPLIRMKNLKKYFPVVGKQGFFKDEILDLKANDGISLDIMKGETFGLVGESGCGKSTFGRALLQIYEQTSGRTVYFGRDVYEFNPTYVPALINKLQINRDEALKLGEETRVAFEEYQELSHDDENKQGKFVKYDNMRQEYENLMFDVTSIAGGLALEEDMTPIIKLLEEEFDLKVKLAKNNAKKSSRRKSENDGKTKNSDLENRIAKVEEELNAYREKLKTEEDYDLYESDRELGLDLTKLTGEEMRVLRKDMQLIFQDPYSSLNPRLTVGQIISEGMFTHGILGRKEKKDQEHILKIMDQCGLAPYFVHRYPHQFSGGQRQRIGIARSVALEPEFIVCDEAVSALDVSIQSQIINLLLDLKEDKNLTYLFISHDLSVIKYISDRVGVMYLGNMVEIAETQELFRNPKHPYTEALLSAIPTTDRDVVREEIIIDGDIPSPINPPSGCKFHTRCPYATDICIEIVPLMEEVAPGHLVACHHKLENGEG